MEEEHVLQELAERIEHHLTKLASFTATECGVTRLPFTAEGKDAVDYLASAMQDAGLSVQVDDTGAVHGLRSSPANQRIVIGSPYDTVREGGAFYGIAGVICGIELARLIRGENLSCGLEVVGFNDEEGVRFGDGFLSSKALLGEIGLEAMKARRDADGISIYEAARRAGYDPEQIEEERWTIENLRAFFEIHIEQGRVLEALGKKLGIVTGIVGMRRYAIRLEGQPDHAGTTPMDMRRDALQVAAYAVLAAVKAAERWPGAVATVGSLIVAPNAVNTVPGSVVLSLDLRSMKPEELAAMASEIFAVMNERAKDAGVTVDITEKLRSEPGEMDARLCKLLTECAAKREIEPHAMISGAGHDALPISFHVPTAMLFVPSRDGRSHCPEEWSSAKDLARAVLVLKDAVMALQASIQA